MDNDAKMLEAMGNAVVTLQLKFRASSLADRTAIRPTLEKLNDDYIKYQVSLLKEGVITTDDDLKEMRAIQKEIDVAADRQKFIEALARTVAFVATKL